MLEFWVFYCPPGVDRTQAQRGDVLCPMTTVFSDSVERVRAAFPTALHIMQVG